MTQPGKHRAAHRAERGGRSRSLLARPRRRAGADPDTAFSISRLDSDDDAPAVRGERPPGRRARRGRARRRGPCKDRSGDVGRGAAGPRRGNRHTG
ncbi:hypothetical protein QJS66_15665 [Kocuria rhizophila]|nr:hypothetical protein QJS66_15665 [Kocuria rhizophila]